MSRHLPGYIFFGLAYAFIAFVALFASPGTRPLASSNTEVGMTLAGSAPAGMAAGSAADRDRR